MSRCAQKPSSLRLEDMRELLGGGDGQAACAGIAYIGGDLEDALEACGQPGLWRAKTNNMRQKLAQSLAQFWLSS